MKNLQVDSILERISNNLDDVFRNYNISDKKIAIYGLDAFSQAIESLLVNRKMSADYYVLYDEQLITSTRRRIKGLAARYLKVQSETIGIEFVHNMAPDDTIILLASDISDEESRKLLEDGYEVGRNLFNLYDRSLDGFAEFVKDKRPIALKDIQKQEKEILKDFDRFCRENSLRYWVCGGTLLGTIRHKGFIPWDDDIDVFTPWEDYQRLIEIYADNDKYRMVCMEKKEFVGDCYTIWGKIVENTTIVREHGNMMDCIHPLWIDIFPIIGMPSEQEQRDDMLREALEVERNFTEKFYRNNGSIIRRNDAYTDIIEISRRYDFDESDYVGIIGTQYREKDIMTRKIFDETIRMPFEDIEVNVPVGYKEYLDNIYGLNWMKIPDESKRRTHDMEAYWL